MYSTHKKIDLKWTKSLQKKNKEINRNVKYVFFVYYQWVERESLHISVDIT